MKFDNRSPINLESSEKLASFEQDGGAYRGVGWTSWTIYKGRKLHVVYSHNSGCDYGSGTHTSREHLGMFDNLESLGKWLLARTDDNGNYPQWASELVEKLGIEVESA